MNSTSAEDMASDSIGTGKVSRGLWTDVLEDTAEATVHALAAGTYGDGASDLEVGADIFTVARRARSNGHGDSMALPN